MLSYNRAQAIRLAPAIWNWVHLTGLYKGVSQMCFSEKILQLIPINNTWIYQVHVCVCVCMFLQLWMIVYVCLLRGVRMFVYLIQKKSTVYASPVVTPASAHSNSSHLAAEQLPFNWMLALFHLILTKEKSTTLTLCYPELTFSQLFDESGYRREKKHTNIFFCFSDIVSYQHLHHRHQRGICTLTLTSMQILYIPLMFVELCLVVWVGSRAWKGEVLRLA